jgi:hypothetical protein
MRPEYDFSAAVRGVTAARYAQGANIAVKPEVLAPVSAPATPSGNKGTRRLTRLLQGS